MNSVRRVFSSSSLLLRLRYYSSTITNTNTRKFKSKFPKPTQIPFQPKLANSVNLIGTVNKPVHFQTSPDDDDRSNPFAATTIVTRLDQTIPLIFQGHLAHTANFHLKLNDVVHVVGQLSTHHPKHSKSQYPFQSLNFVEGYPSVKKTSLTSKPNIGSSSESEDDIINSLKKDIHSEETEELVMKKSWKDILNNPSEKQDVHSTKESPESATFNRETDGELQPELKQSKPSAKKSSDSFSNSWDDLLNDPKQWWDCRESKRSGLVGPRYPDFKRKDRDVPIWISRAPKWVLSKLKELEFDVQVVKSKQANDNKGDESWNDLLQNPAKWWDNRLNKKNERAPDFKHKDTGVGLWLRGSPSWVLPKLPPLKLKEQSEETGGKPTPVSRVLEKEA